MSTSDWYTRNSHWLILSIYLVGFAPVIWWLGADYSYNRVYSEYATAQAQTKAQEEFERECVRYVDAQKILTCYREKIQSARDTQRAEEDLKAQKDMASWALGMFIATWILGILSVAVAVYVANFVRRTLLATHEANQISKQGLLILERPYVVMEIERNGILVEQHGQLSFAGQRFTYAFVNYGRSAAVIKEVYVSWPMVNIGEMPERIDPKVTQGRRASVGVVSAIDNPHREFEKLFTVADHRLLQADAWQKYQLCFIGFVRYQDFFENSYITGFCARFDPIRERWMLIGGKAGYNYQTSVPKED